jgi:hypothetical protein
LIRYPCVLLRDESGRVLTGSTYQFNNRPSPNPPGVWPGLGLEPASPVASGPGLAAGAFADNTCVLNGRVDELALYKRLLIAGERAWLSRNNGQGRAYNRSGIADSSAGKFLCGV